MTHYQRLACPPKYDYRPPRPGRLVVPWGLHPKATRATALQASDLTPFMPPVGNQDQIGACNSYGTKDGAATSLAKAGKPLPGYLAALPLYRGVRCLERAQSTSGALPPLTDCGAGPDDVLTFAQQFGIQTSLQAVSYTHLTLPTKRIV